MIEEVDILGHYQSFLTNREGHVYHRFEETTVEGNECRARIPTTGWKFSFEARMFVQCQLYHEVGEGYIWTTDYHPDKEARHISATYRVQLCHQRFHRHHLLERLFLHRATAGIPHVNARLIVEKPEASHTFDTTR